MTTTVFAPSIRNLYCAREGKKVAFVVGGFDDVYRRFVDSTVSDTIREVYADATKLFEYDETLR